MNAELINTRRVADMVDRDTRADRAPGLVRRLLDRLAERRRYWRTVNELEALSDRDLADVGLRRHDIHRLAGTLVTRPGAR